MNDTVQTIEFSIQRQNPPKTLVHAFLDNLPIDKNNPPPMIAARNGVIYQAIYQFNAVTEDPEYIPCLISFQKHTFGAFAIVRRARTQRS